MTTAFKNYLGIDWGEKRIGLATADSETKLAIPFKVVSSLNELLKLITVEEINYIVLGYPRKMNGDPANNPKWQAFVSQLEKQIDLPIVFLDERLSSLAADALAKKNKAKAGRDEIAAALILQNYLDGAR